MDISKDIMGLVLLSKFRAVVKSSDLLFKQRTKMDKAMIAKTTGWPL